MDYWRERKGKDDVWYDEGEHPQDVVACPGVELPPLENSCYVNIDDIPELEIEDV